MLSKDNNRLLISNEWIILTWRPFCLTLAPFCGAFLGLRQWISTWMVSWVIPSYLVWRSTCVFGGGSNFLKREVLEIEGMILAGGFKYLLFAPLFGEFMIFMHHVFVGRAEKMVKFHGFSFVCSLEKGNSIYNSWCNMIKFPLKWEDCL